MPPTIKSAASTSTQPILAPVEASAPLWELEEPPPDPEPGPEPPPAAPLAVVDLLEPSDFPVLFPLAPAFDPDEVEALDFSEPGLLVPVLFEPLSGLVAPGCLSFEESAGLPSSSSLSLSAPFRRAGWLNRLRGRSRCASR